MSTLPRILLTAGEPAGVGPDLIVRIAQQDWPAKLAVIADPELLKQRAEILKLDLEFHVIDSPDAIPPHRKNQLTILPVTAPIKAQPGTLQIENAAYVIETLRLASQYALQKKIDAIVTAPVNKAVLNEAGFSFAGHTEYFAQQAGVKRTVMLFVIDDLKIATTTTHLPLSQVSSAITKELLQETLAILHKGLQQTFKISHPRICVTGLNPHAGENGYLGREEIDVIAPAMDDYAKQHSQSLQLSGPVSADTAFTPSALKQTDAVLAMYHDQALPVVKHIGFELAVNITLGLPFIRTSVDHGTALNIAGTDKVNLGSMNAALNLAIKLAGK